MGFDVGKAMRGLDPERFPGSQEEVLRRFQRYQELFRSIGGQEKMLRCVQGNVARTIGAYSASLATRPYGLLIVSPNLSSTPNYFSTPNLFKPPNHAKSLLPKALGLSGGFAGLNYSPPRPRFTVPGHGGLFENLGLSSNIARMFESHGLGSAYGAAWHLQRVQSVRTSALQTLLKTATTFGPIVVSPDYEDDAPFNYSPDLRGLIPETATESGVAVDFEELWAEVVAFAQGIARHHRTEVLLSAIGQGHRFLIRVSKDPAVGHTVAGTVGGAAGGAVGGQVVNVVSGAVSGGVTGLVTYVLTRR